MKISNHGYVIIKPKQSLLGLAGIIGTPSGKTRIRADGEIEAEFFCINPGSACSTIWASKEELSTPPTD